MVEPDIRIDALEGPDDLTGVLEVAAESFTNPWTREMYEWELQNRSVCHIYVARLPECRVAGFCALWLVVDEIHVNNLAVRPAFRGRGIGTTLLRHVFMEGLDRGARRATLEVRASNQGAIRFYARLGFVESGRRRQYYSSPVEDAVILWRDHDRPGQPPDHLSR